MLAVLDARDAALLQHRVKLRDQVPGPRVGDWIEWPGGERGRLTYRWGDSIQTTCRGGGPGSFYLGNGFCTYSGSLDPAVKLEQLEEAGSAPGPAWFFHHDFPEAGAGIEVEIPCRIFLLREKP